MKRTPPSHKTARNLSEPAHQRLKTYALAASASGVAMLALALPAEGKIVYRRDNQPIPPGFVPS